MTDSQASLDILIAEDDLHLGEALAGCLREKGHRVDLALNGREALELLKARDYSLVIADLVMPEADGLAVLREARQKDKATLVMIMTGHASLDSALEATRQGAYDYLRKPFKLQEIDVAVANAARLLTLRRENQQLLEKLDDLQARLADQHRAGQKAPCGPQPASDAKVPLPSLPFPWRDSLPGLGDRRQAHLLRLRHLYRENLLTEGEYRTLKQRLCI